MAIQMTATELKAKLLAVLDEVSAGGDEVAVTKHGRTIARLVPARGPAGLKGAYSGQVFTTGTDEELFSADVTWDFD